MGGVGRKWGQQHLCESTTAVINLFGNKVHTVNQIFVHDKLKQSNRRKDSSSQDNIISFWLELTLLLWCL